MSDPDKVRAQRLNAIAKSWRSFFVNRRGRKRHGLTTQTLMDLLERQGGLCALTQVPLTRVRGQGRGKKFPTNASLDRINPGGAYEDGNLQLVCSCVNNFRGDLSLESFIEWCRRVVIVHDYNVLKKLPA